MNMHDIHEYAVSVKTRIRYFKYAVQQLVGAIPLRALAC